MPNPEAKRPLFIKITALETQPKLKGSMPGDIVLGANGTRYYRKLSELFENYPSALLELIFYRIYERLNLAPKAYLNLVDKETAFAMLKKTYGENAEFQDIADKFRRKVLDSLRLILTFLEEKGEIMPKMKERILNGLIDIIHTNTQHDLSNDDINHIVFEFFCLLGKLENEGTINTVTRDIIAKDFMDNFSIETVQKNKTVLLTQESREELIKRLFVAKLNDEYLTICTEEIGTASSEFISAYAYIYQTLPDQLENFNGEIYKIKDLGKIVALAKLLGDSDWLGYDGDLRFDEHHKGEYHAKIVDVGRSMYDQLPPERDIQFSAMVETKIKFDSLPENIKNEFIDTLIEFEKIGFEEIVYAPLKEYDELTNQSFRLTFLNSLKIRNQAQFICNYINERFIICQDLFKNEIEARKIAHSTSEALATDSIKQRTNNGL